MKRTVLAIGACCALLCSVNAVAGEHEIELHSKFVDYGAAFDNACHITVRQPGKIK